MEKLDMQLIDAVKFNEVFKVDYLINKGANINVKTEDLGLTPLMIAVSEGYFEMAEMLIKLGADVNKKNKFGDTALMYAVVYTEPKLIKLLINSGADLKAKNNKNITALDFAKVNCYKQAQDILENALKKQELEK